MCDADDYKETPQWRYWMYPIGGALGVLLLLGAIWFFS